jgi:hypothetical protein
VIRSALLVLTASLALYGGTLGHFFVSDDFLNFERNGFVTLGDALGFFGTRDVDFYRPIARLHFGVLRGLAGDRVLAWNLTGVVLHALASWLVAAFAASCLGRPRARAATWAGVFFAVHFIHVEPVVWASAVTSLWSAIFVLAALLAFRRSRRTGSASYGVLAVLAFAAALGSKEDAIAFVPLLFLTTWWWPIDGAEGRARLPSIAEFAPFAILVAAWAIVVGGIDRGGDASPYRVALGAHVLRNVAFFALGGFVPLRYWEVRDRCEGGVAPCLEQLASRPDLAVPILAGLVAVGWLARRGSRDVQGGLLWTLVAATPFLVLTGSGERFLYLPSVGASLVWGLLAEELLRRAGTRRRAAAQLGVATALALHVAGNLDRQRDWMTASAWTRAIAGRWSAFEGRDPGKPIEFVGVLGEWRSAWVFRNGFDSMVRLYWRGRPYAREGELPPGLPPAERLAVTWHRNGTVGMMPAHLVPPP